MRIFIALDAIISLCAVCAPLLACASLGTELRSCPLNAPLWQSRQTNGPFI